MKKSKPTEVTRQYRSALKDARQIFIRITGYYSDPSWYRFRKSLEAVGFLKEGMSDSDLKANVTLASKLRRQCPQTGVDFVSVLKFYLQEERVTKELGNRTVTGEEIVELIKRQGIPLPNSTRTMWFEEIGGYKSKRSYKSEETKHVLLLAAIYKARKQQQT